jgi:hypothetical protein
MSFPSLGYQLVDLAETMLVHGPGDVQGSPIEIDDEFAKFWINAYRLNPESGRRVYSRAFLSRAKGRDKSGHAARKVIMEALGPVRFSHWARKGETSWWGYRYEVGEPVGRPVTYPFIRILATEEGQTGNTYDAVQYLLHNEHVLSYLESSDCIDWMNWYDREVRLDVGLTRTFLGGSVGDGEIVPSTASSSSKDGGKETFVVFDETHLYTIPVLRQMYRTVRRNMTKRKDSEPWGLETSTMFGPGEDSVAEDTYKLYLLVKEGKAAAEAGTLVDHLEGPEPADWDDPAELRRCLEVAYGDACGWIDLDSKVQQILEDGPKFRHEHRRYFYNRPSRAGAGRLLDADTAARLLHPSTELPDGSPIAIGFDGSETGDSTWVVATHMVTGIAYVLAAWERPIEVSKTDFKVNKEEVDQVMREVLSRYQVAWGCIDPSRFHEYLAGWQAAFPDSHLERFPVWNLTQTTDAITMAEQQIANGTCLISQQAADVGLIRHGQNATIVTLDGARLRKQYKQVVKPEDTDTGMKALSFVDGAVAWIYCIEARRRALAKGWVPEPEPVAPLVIWA